jgi:hypothetical protein
VKPSATSKAAALLPTMSNKSQNIEILPVHPFDELIRNDPNLTPEQKKDHEASREAQAFFKFAVKATQGKFKKSGSSMLVNIAAKDLKQIAKIVRQAGVDGDARCFQGLSIIQKAEAMGDVGFFKSLGRALSKNNDQAWGWDNLNLAMLKLIWEKPGISDRDAEEELKKQGFGQATTAENFNKFYNRVRASLPPEWQHLFPKRKPGRRKS